MVAVVYPEKPCVYLGIYTFRFTTANVESFESHSVDSSCLGSTRAIVLMQALSSKAALRQEPKELLVTIRATIILPPRNKKRRGGNVYGERHEGATEGAIGILHLSKYDGNSFQVYIYIYIYTTDHHFNCRYF